MSDVAAFLIALIIFAFNLIPESTVKDSKIRYALYVVVWALLTVLGRFVLPAGTVLALPVGSLFIHWYGVLIMLGALAAAWLSVRESKRRGINPDYIWDMLPWLLVAGVIGARIWHIFFPPESMIEAGITTQYYFAHPLEMLQIWNGGLGIPGAVIAGAIALFYYCLVRKQSFGAWVDIIAPGLALAQAIGRWGNFLNQEVYGSPSTLPWAIYIDPAHRLPAFANVATYHPLFLYESIWDLLLMGLLLWLGRRYVKQLISGDLFLVYMFVYGLGRFGLEFIRLDPAPIAGIDINQMAMLVVMVIAAAFLFVRHVLHRGEPEVDEEEETPAPESTEDKGDKLQAD
ncbi:MAG TPA: prolipoprotein diacylglyceryl transferase [Longilinea sp.]|nr:prolipoprotein diacylglyceryl transferase [Longilinea sp.]